MPTALRQRSDNELTWQHCRAMNTPMATARASRRSMLREEKSECVRSFWPSWSRGWLAASTGCLIPMYSADPARRAQQLIFTSEDLRTFLDEWERIWFLDQPSHMTPLRTHGGII